MPMSPRLLRPRATVHPEAAAWSARVVANGGSVSGTTMSAVSKFCAAIASAGIRDRFYRLNLFCGTGLNAALVPLYRGPSLGGTQYGGATDTNVGPFVSGDFAEAGAGGGLKGNGTSKYLDTGVLLDTLHSSFPSLHMSAYVTATASTPAYVGGLFSGGASGFALGVGVQQLGGTVAITDVASVSLAGNHLVSRTAADSLAYYRNSTSVSSSSASASSATNAAQKVFVLSRSGATNAPVGYSDQYFRSYSLGLGLTNAQVAAYYSAMQAFQTALGRNV